MIILTPIVLHPTFRGPACRVAVYCWDCRPDRRLPASRAGFSRFDFRRHRRSSTPSSSAPFRWRRVDDCEGRRGRPGHKPTWRRKRISVKRKRNGKDATYEDSKDKDHRCCFSSRAKLKILSTASSTTSLGKRLLPRFRQTRLHHPRRRFRPSRTPPMRRRRCSPTKTSC